MEKFAVEAYEHQRDSQIKAAIKSNVPWTTLAEDFGMSLEEIIKVTERLGLSSSRPKPDDLLDSRKEVGPRGR